MTSIDVGVYFGGSSMTVAYYRDEKISIIVNEAGDRTTPALLALNESEYSVGLPAKQNLIRNAKNTVSFAKHFVGRLETDPVYKDLTQRLDCQVVRQTTCNTHSKCKSTFNNQSSTTTTTTKAGRQGD